MGTEKTKEDRIYCKKILQHRERIEWFKNRSDVIYDPTEADKCIDWIQKYIKHFESPFIGKPFIIEDWQRHDIIEPIFSFYRENELGVRERIVKTVYCQIGRKNGKTTLFAAIALYLLFNMGRGKNILTGAASIKQAKGTLFNILSRLAGGNPEIAKRLSIEKERIFTKPYRGSHPDNKIMLLAGNSEKQSGYNASVGLMDEFHEMASDYLMDIVETATATQPDAIIMITTTAGANQADSTCFTYYERSKQVLENKEGDDSFLPIIYEADDDLEWDSPEAYTQANPNLNVTVREQFLKNFISEAEILPAKRKKYEFLHLNRWQSGGRGQKWLSVDAWDECKGSTTLNDLAERKVPCWVGFDCSKGTDLTAITALFEDGAKLKMFSWYFAPEDTLESRSKADKVPYDVWRDMQILEAMPGSVIRQDIFFERLRAILAKYNVQAVSFDPAHTSEIRNDLEELPFPITEFRSDFMSYNPSCKKFEELISTKEIEHDGNPITRWGIEIIPLFENYTGLVRPDKKTLRSNGRGRIDGIDAALMALEPYLRMRNAAPEVPDNYDRDAVLSRMANLVF